MMDHFGDAARGIRGNWLDGDNLKTFNELTEQGISPEVAAAKTFTGKMAAEHGFTKVEIISTVGKPGQYVCAEVIYYF